MIVFGGFYGDKGYSSSILSYDIEKDSWNILFKGENNSP